MRVKRLAPSLLLALVLVGILVAGFIYTWNALTWGRDSPFLQGLLAGGVGIVVDAVLVALIVNHILDYRETSRWRFARQWLVDRILRDVTLVFFYVHSRIYTGILESGLAVHLPEDVRRLLDNNFVKDDREIKHIPKLIDIPNRIRQTIDQQSVALNAELAAFLTKVLENVESLAMPSLALSPSRGDRLGDKTTIRLLVFDPLERLHSTCEQFASFIELELTGTLSAFVDTTPKDRDMHIFKSEMLGSLLLDFHSEFDSLQEGKIMKCKNFRACCAPLFNS
jgi:hypothetical protein